jgi:hypothetical protein
MLFVDKYGNNEDDANLWSNDDRILGNRISMRELKYWISRMIRMPNRSVDLHV